MDGRAHLLEPITSAATSESADLRFAHLAGDRHLGGGAGRDARHVDRLVAGYRGGRIDDLCMRLTDTMLAMPFILLALSVIAVLGSSCATLSLSSALPAGYPTLASCERKS